MNKYSGYKKQLLFAYLMACFIFLNSFSLTWSATTYDTPILYYASAKAGPNRGWEGSPNKGAAITIWAKNIGASRGISTLTVAGVILNKDSDFAEWGATANPKTPKGFQRITFWLNSSMPVGNTDGIYATVNGKKSNILPFKIDNTGRIFFLSLNGADSNDGRYATNQENGLGPWKNFGKATSKMQPGDFLYMRAGEWTYIHSNETDRYEYIGQPQYEAPINGTDSLIITVTSYPGELAVFKNSTVYNYSDYWTFVRLKWDGAVNIGAPSYHMGRTDTFCSEYSDHAVGLDLIGSEFAGYADHAIHAAGDDIRILANVFSNVPTDDTSYPLYMSAGKGRIIKDNDLSGGSSFAIHAYDEDRPNCTDIGRVMENWVIEGNLIDASDKGYGYRNAILLGATSVATMQNIIIRNNILFSNGSALASGIKLFMGNEKNIKIYNNTFYGFPVGIEIANISSPTIDNIFIKNNIFSNISIMHINNNAQVPITIIAERNLYGSTPKMKAVTDADPVVGNPQFVEVANYNFYLQSTSPAIDKGLTLSEVSTDYDGISRPQGSAYDIGAYEYSSLISGDTIPPASPLGLAVK